MQREKDNPTPGQQAHRARGDLAGRALHMALPWAGYAALTVFANVLLAAAHFSRPFGRWLWLAVTLAGLAGSAVAAFDLHMRLRRFDSFAGRYLAPVLIEAASLMTVVFLTAGYSIPLVLLWLFGGISGCLAWDLWLFGHAHHDLATRMGSAAGAAGLEGTRLMIKAKPRRRAIAAAKAPARDPQEAPPLAPSGTRAWPLPAAGAAAADRPLPPGPPARRGAPARTEATVAWPAGAFTPEEAAAQVTRIEGAAGMAPGSISLTPNGKQASWSDAVISDPETLAESMPWPGPSHPGGTLADPFRLGLRQDAEWFWLSLLPVFHLRVSGTTGTAKTMAGMWNFMAEGVTRESFAAFVIDKAKRNQFAGPLRSALHGLDIEDDQILRRMLALRRARSARLDYMAARGLTAWTPGCGLSFVCTWMEEGPSTLNAVAEMAKSMAGDQRFTVNDWAEGAKNDRSAGMMWAFSNQLSLTATELPAVARGQFNGLFCFGTNNRKESEIGLSEQQYRAGCAPHDWRQSHPGKMYADAPTMDVADITMPLRLFEWESADVIRAYTDQWPAEQRPLDEVTAEAMADVPALPDSYYPHASSAGEKRGPGRPRKDGQPPRRADPRDNVRQLRPPSLVRSEKTDEAEAQVIYMLAHWLSKGREFFTFEDLTKSGLWPAAGEGPGGLTGKTRTWGYAVLRVLVRTGYAEEITEKGQRKRWKILPKAAAYREEM